ncbi:hypothetical protein D3C86_1792300 [compost metagenome]
MSGNVVSLTQASMQLLDLPEHCFDTQQYVMLGCPAERWEFAFRHNLKRAVLENIYAFPKGVMIVQSYHHEINPSPDNPTSKIYLRDISGRCSLEAWLKNIKEPVRVNATHVSYST